VPDQRYLLITSVRHQPVPSINIFKGVGRRLKQGVQRRQADGGSYRILRIGIMNQAESILIGNVKRARRKLSLSVKFRGIGTCS